MQNSPVKKNAKQRTSIFDPEVKKHNVSRNSMLSSLRATQLIVAKPVLPMELISVILEYVPPASLIRCAQVSRRLKDMVYDETRWRARLQTIGVTEDNTVHQAQTDPVRHRYGSLGSRPPDAPRVAGGHGDQRDPSSLLDVGGSPESRPRSNTHRKKPSIADGFEDLTLSSNTPTTAQPSAVHMRAADILRNVTLVHGQARQTFGKIYSALYPFYVDTTRSSYTSDPMVFRIFSDPEQQARVLHNLGKLSRVDGDVGHAQRLKRLHETTELFTNRMMNDFRNAYDNRDTAGMRRCVNVAIVLGDTQSMVDTFIDSHPLMTGTQRLANPADCVDGVAAGHVDLGPSRRFFERLAVIFAEQSGLIDQVFPSTMDVLNQFLHKVNTKVIQAFVGTTLGIARDTGRETFLKAVPGVLEQCIRFSVSFTPTKAASSTFQQDTQAYLLEGFKDHVDTYLNDELNWFKAKAEDGVQVWERNLSEQESRNESFFMSNVSRQAAKRDFLSSFKKVVLMPVNAVAAFPLPGTGSRATSLQVAADAEKSSRPSTPVLAGGAFAPALEAPTTELAAKAAIMNARLEGIKTLFSIEVALDLVHLAKASIERLVVLARPGSPFAAKASQQCEAVFINLIQILGQQHIKTGFDKAVNHLDSYNSRDLKTPHPSSIDSSGVEPLVTFLELVNVGDLIQQMVDVFYAQELVSARITERDDFLNPAAKAKKAFEQMLDERVAAGMSKGIDVLLSEVDFLCATTQLPTDFNPPANIPMPDIGPTPTAQKVTALVAHHTSMLAGSTDKAMLDVFLQEVGLRLAGAVAKHIKRQRVSADGAIRLISDINAYSAFIAELKQKPLAPYVAALRELAGVYLVDVTGPARAKELAAIIADTERYRGVFSVEEVLEFAERRADWYHIKADVERAMYGIGCCVM